MFQNSLLGIAFDAAMEQLEQEENLMMLTSHQKLANTSAVVNNNNDNDNEEDDDEINNFNIEAQNRILDNLFARYDVTSSSTISDDNVDDDHNINKVRKQQQQTAFTQEQKDKLQRIFTDSMVEALTNRKQSSTTSSTVGFSSFPKNDLIIRAPALGGLVEKYCGGGDEIDNKNNNTNKSDDVYFPIYKRDGNGDWTIILKDPQIFLRGPVVDQQQNNLMEQNEGKTNNNIDYNKSPLQRLIKLVMNSNDDDDDDEQQENNSSKSKSKLSKTSKNTKNDSDDKKKKKLRGDGVELECDYVVMHVRELPVLKRGKATRRGRE